MSLGERTPVATDHALSHHGYMPRHGHQQPASLLPVQQTHATLQQHLTHVSSLPAHTPTAATPNYHYAPASGLTSGQAVMPSLSHNHQPRQPPAFSLATNAVAATALASAPSSSSASSAPSSAAEHQSHYAPIHGFAVSGDMPSTGLPSYSGPGGSTAHHPSSQGYSTAYTVSGTSSASSTAPTSYPQLPPTSFAHHSSHSGNAHATLPFIHDAPQTTAVPLSYGGNSGLPAPSSLGALHASYAPGSSGHRFNSHTNHIGASHATGAPTATSLYEGSHHTIGANASSFGMHHGYEGGAGLFGGHGIDANGLLPLKAKRRQVKNACVNCQKACKKCDEGRPCSRCVKLGLEASCVDSSRKERKRGMKRGPYKRRSVNSGSQFGNSHGNSYGASSMATDNSSGSGSSHGGGGQYSNSYATMGDNKAAEGWPGHAAYRHEVRKTSHSPVHQTGMYTNHSNGSSPPLAAVPGLSSHGRGNNPIRLGEHEYGTATGSGFHGLVSMPTGNTTPSGLSGLSALYSVSNNGSRLGATSSPLLSSSLNHGTASAYPPPLAYTANGANVSGGIISGNNGSSSSISSSNNNSSNNSSSQYRYQSDGSLPSTSAGSSDSRSPRTPLAYGGGMIPSIDLADQSVEAHGSFVGMAKPHGNANGGGASPYHGFANATALAPLTTNAFLNASSTNQPFPLQLPATARMRGVHGNGNVPAMANTLISQRSR